MVCLMECVLYNNNCRIEINIQNNEIAYKKNLYIGRSGANEPRPWAEITRASVIKGTSLDFGKFEHLLLF